MIQTVETGPVRMALTYPYVLTLTVRFEADFGAFA